MTSRIDPKTRRLIVSDLTPSVKGEITTLNEYADYIAFLLSTINETLKSNEKLLKEINEKLAELE